MRERVNVDDFKTNNADSIPNLTDTLAQKVAKLVDRGWGAEKIADKLCNIRDLYSGQVVRNEHWQKLYKEVLRAMEGLC